MTFQTLCKPIQRNEFHLWQREIPCLHFVFTSHCECASHIINFCYHNATSDCGMNSQAKLQFILLTSNMVSVCLGQEQWWDSQFTVFGMNKTHSEDSYMQTRWYKITSRILHKESTKINKYTTKKYEKEVESCSFEFSNNAYF